MKLRNVGAFSLAASLMIGAPALAADKTPPTKPVVTDDGDYTNSSTSLHAKWTSSDPESGISKYRYHIREDSISGRKIIDWTSAGLASEITLSGLSLRNGKTYFIGVRSINGNGKESEVGYSNGITIQAAAATENVAPSTGVNRVVTEDGRTATDDAMQPVTIRGNKFYSNGKPYFLSTHFLLMNPNSSHSYFSDLLSDTDRQTIVNYIKSGGYNSIFLYTLNQGDYGGKSVSPYQSGIIGGLFDVDKIRSWKDELVSLINQGIRPILWLVADNSSVIAGASTVELKRYIQKMVESFDDLPIMWVLGLEVDEYWSKARADDLGSYLQAIADNPVGIHQLKGQTNMMTSPWVEFGAYQEGFKGDWSTIYYSALQKQAAIGHKPFIFAEYEHGITVASFQKGLAAAFAGSAGVGNGAPGSLDEFIASLPDNMVPSRSGNNLYLSGSGIVAVADLINLTFSAYEGQ